MGTHKKIEGQTGEKASSKGGVWVVSGPSYLGNFLHPALSPLNKLHGHPSSGKLVLLLLLLL